MSFSSLNTRTQKALSDAGIKTAVQALQAGRAGLTAISGIGEATADQILALAEAELAGAAGDTLPTVPEIGETTPNEEPALQNKSDSSGEPDPDQDEATLPTDDEDLPTNDEEEAERPTEVVMRLNALASAVLGNSRILQGESRRVPYAQYETAVADYPGAWLVRFHRDGEFEVA